MSYILDALKKSEREKTLGQVPTLESVVSDGAKKKRTGTPWWLNLVVFFVTLIAVFGILNMAGLINFSGSGDSDSQLTNQAQVSPGNADAGEPAAQSVVFDPAIEPSTDPAMQADQSAVDVIQADQSLSSAGQAQDTPSQQADNLEATVTQAEPVDVLNDVPADLALTNDEQQASLDENTTQQLEQKFAVQEAEELAALALQLEAQELMDEQNSDNNSASQQQASIEQPSTPQYEEVIHDGLRDISVNVVSYSSDARQRFVMLDLTIYKEGDQLANNAQIVEIIRTGAIVEFQNKRYLLKP